ncbi:MAG: hypothetical protein ACUVS4_15470 [Chloroflexaceae bacterium]
MAFRSGHRAMAPGLDYHVQMAPLLDQCSTRVAEVDELERLARAQRVGEAGLPAHGLAAPDQLLSRQSAHGLGNDRLLAG